MNKKIWNIYNLVIDWIKFADVKAGLLLALNTGIITIFSTVLLQKKLINLIPNDICFAISLISFIITWTISTIYLILCLNPNLKTANNSKSILYYGDIADKYDSHNDLYNEIINKTEDEFIKNDLTRQLNIISQIAKTKYDNIKNAINYYITLLFSFLFCLLFYIV